MAGLDELLRKVNIAGIDGLLKNETSKTLAIGVGVGIVAPLVIPALTAVAGPVGRAALKSGIIAYEKGRETVAELGEVLDDLVAEARAEIEQDGPAESESIAGIVSEVTGTHET